MALTEYAVLFASGYADDEPPGSECGVITARNELGTLLGLIAYETDGSDGVWIALDFVLNAGRRRGIWSLMWQELLDLARAEGMKRIRFVVHAENKARIAVAEKIGAQVQYLTYQYEIEGGVT